jgi:hypothetical protein
MFRSVGFAVSAVVLCFLSSSLWAHGGELNSEGCHNDKKAGEYHCHRGGSKTATKSNSKSGKYDRDNWGFRSSASAESSSLLGWYTGVSGSATDVDHVVALKDAYVSGGHNWSRAQKLTFANDPFNHVAAVPYVNRTLKNAYVPLKFIAKLGRSRYAFVNGKCVEYVNLYVQVKKKYGLSFVHNNINKAKLACK